MACPEPGAITVLQTVIGKTAEGREMNAGVEGAISCASN
jgi:hypothetical protein